jgi:hypothetical protein
MPALSPATYVVCWQPPRGPHLNLAAAIGVAQMDTSQSEAEA